jgi:class I fructose-bisphosphate aldolase
MNTLEERVRHIIKTAFDGRRIVVFSGGNAKGEEEIYNEITNLQ